MSQLQQATDKSTSSKSVAGGVHHVEHVMGMPVVIDIRDLVMPEVGRSAVASVVEWLHSVDARWSTYRGDSMITRFALGQITPGDLPAEMHAILDRCELLSSETGGLFDIHLPTHRRAPNGTLLEPSGFIKGWAIEEAALVLSRLGLVNFCINAGGDAVVRGCAAPGVPWRVGVRHPLDPQAFAEVIAAHGTTAIATSGTYERGQHIFDPRTGEPADLVLSATVVGRDLAVVDVEATVLFVLGEQGLERILDADGLDAMVITKDGRCMSTPGFAALTAD